MTVRQWALLALLSLFWGTSFMFQKIALVDIPPATLACLRAAIASLILLAVMKATESPDDRGPGWLPLILIGATSSALPHFLIAWGQQHIDSALAGMMQSTAPLFTIVLAHFFVADEPMQGRRLLGVAVGIAGVVLLIGPGVLLGVDAGVLGQFAVIAATLSYAVTNVYGRRFRTVKPIRMAAGSMAFAALFNAPMMLLHDRPWALEISTDSLLALLTVGVAGTGVPILLFYYLLNTIGATNTSLVSFLVPAVAVLSGTVFLGETLALNAYAAFAVILLGLLTVNPPRLRRPIPNP